MSKARKNNTASQEPAANPSEDNKKTIDSNIPAIIKETGGCVVGIIGAIGGLLTVLYTIGVFPPGRNVTPSPTLSPTSAWTVTLTPGETPTPPRLPPTATETPVPLPTLPPTLTLTPEPTGTLSIGCPWRPFSTYDASLVVANNCLYDLLPWGISGQDPVLFYRERGMNIGIYGISQQWEKPDELRVTLQVNVLREVRFLVLWSSKEVGYKDSIGFRLIREDKTRVIQLVTYDARGYPETISEIQDLPMWNGKLNLRLEARGPMVRAYVNDTYFGQSQITFIKQFLFLGYQVMSGGENKPALDVIVDLP